MRLKTLRLAWIALCLAASACAIDHNIPTNPVSWQAPAERLTLYADANGHLYPDSWIPPFDRARIERRHSLLAAAGFDRRVHDELRAERERQLDAAAARLADRRRVFILVHGFNNSQADARLGFDAVRRWLPDAGSDGVVEFHWDGLSSPNLLGQGAMWFNAAGYSQLAGTQALRGLLRRLADKTVIVIAHSRGASVVLSALSDPAYNARFQARTEAFLYDDFHAPALPRGGGTIDVLLLAAAIGNPDFRRPGARGNDCRSDLRDFPALRSIHYSVNPRDPVLSKLFRPASHHFNATDFGYDPAVGAALADCYRGRVAMTPYPVEDLARHPFVDYAGHAVLRQMLAAVGAAR